MKMIAVLFAVIVFAAPATADANRHHHHKHHAHHAVRSAPVAPPVEQPCCGIVWVSPTWEEWSNEMEAAGFTPKETEEYWLETYNPDA